MISRLRLMSRLPRRRPDSVRLGYKYAEELRLISGSLKRKIRYERRTRLQGFAGSSSKPLVHSLLATTPVSAMTSLSCALPKIARDRSTACRRRSMPSSSLRSTEFNNIRNAGRSLRNCTVEAICSRDVGSVSGLEVSMTLMSSVDLTLGPWYCELTFRLPVWIPLDFV